MGYGALHRNLQIRIVVGAVQRFLYIMFMPLMAVYLSSRFGVTKAGLMMFASTLLEITGTLLGGHLSDRHGRRPLLLTGESGVAAAYTLMALAAAAWWDSALVVYAAFVLSNVAASLALPANDAMVVDVTTVEVRKLVYTINYWAINLALACGVVVGGFLYTKYFPTMLIAVAAGAAAVLAVTFLCISETAPQRTGELPSGGYLRNFALGYRLVLTDKAFLALLCAATLRQALEVQINYYVNIRVSGTMHVQQLFRLGSWRAEVNGVELLGILRAENTLLVVLLAFLVHRMLKRVGDRLRLYLGVALFTGGTMVLAVGGFAWLLIAAMLVLTVGELLNLPVQQTMLAELVSDQDRTKYMAIFNLNVRVALLLGSLGMIVAPLLRSWGMAALYGLFGLLVIGGYRRVLSIRAKAAPAAEPVPVPGGAG
ncbi:MFS transporter [Kitasatospora sp. NBC_01287]|uniref:MFS transporter n=1 Tax=Kitasatospora sp. NBC_01287 TaxID=2903573 RepID=UPI00225156DA|nr:MFS transporter [Kitasatospora sp. NBC_01287]MCX4746932.1 MFS transporter [Kitasatospora sp. NBC_01287]